MPSLQKTESVDVDVDIEFEVYCACGSGLCGSTTVRESRRRGMPQIVIEPCRDCLEAAREEGGESARDELEMRIDTLEAELREVTGRCA